MSFLLFFFYDGGVRAGEHDDGAPLPKKTQLTHRYTHFKEGHREYFEFNFFSPSSLKGSEAEPFQQKRTQRERQ